MLELTPNDIQVVELHDCFATNELITYEGLGLCAMGKCCCEICPPWIEKKKPRNVSDFFFGVYCL